MSKNEEKRHYYQTGLYFDDLLQRVIWVDLKMFQASRICPAAVFLLFAPTGLPLLFVSTAGLMFCWGFACCRSPLVAFAPLNGSLFLLGSYITSLFFHSPVLFRLPLSKFSSQLFPLSFLSVSLSFLQFLLTNFSHFNFALDYQLSFVTSLPSGHYQPFH